LARVFWATGSTSSLPAPPTHGVDVYGGHGNGMGAGQGLEALHRPPDTWENAQQVQFAPTGEHAGHTGPRTQKSYRVRCSGNGETAPPPSGPQRSSHKLSCDIYPLTPGHGCTLQFQVVRSSASGGPTGPASPVLPVCSKTTLDGGRRKMNRPCVQSPYAVAVFSMVVWAQCR